MTTRREFGRHRRLQASAPTPSSKTDTAAENGVVQLKLLADKIISGSCAKIKDCCGGAPHRRQIDLADLADPVDPGCSDSGLHIGIDDAGRQTEDPHPRIDALEQNDEWAVQRARYMTLETIATLSDDQTIKLPMAAA